MKKYLSIPVVILAIVLLQFQPCLAQGKEFNEYEVKAVFLANFLKFVEWPGKDRDPDQYKICTYGNDVFGQYSSIISGIKVRGKALQFRKISSFRAINDCSIIFISPSERRKVHSIIESLRDEDVLTVGDTEGYAREGVMINFYIEASKVKFEINLNSIKRSRMKVSSQLLKLGRMVDRD